MFNQLVDSARQPPASRKGEQANNVDDVKKAKDAKAPDDVKLKDAKEAKDAKAPDDVKLKEAKEGDGASATPGEPTRQRGERAAAAQARATG
jgi:hypothetical protein